MSTPTMELLVDVNAQFMTDPENRRGHLDRCAALGRV